eukprot:scaffold925_cov129-Cylindrotheca_fusiformis.AAC.37
MLTLPLLLPLLALSAHGFVTPGRSRNCLAIYSEETEYVDQLDGDGSDPDKIIENLDSSDAEKAAVTVEEFPDPVVKMDDRPKSVEDMTIKLLQIGASTGRGEFASQYQKDQASELISALEMKNPTEEPTKSPLIQGRWELLYSCTQLFRNSPFFMAGRAVCSTPDQAKQYDWFCDMHRKALAISTIGQVRQVVSNTRLVSEFEVSAGAVPFLNDFTPFAYSGGLPVTVDGAIVSSADITSTEDGTGWELLMDTVEIKGSNIPGLRQVLDGGLKLESRNLGSFLENTIGSYKNPRPVFQTTYLSENLRISRDQDGKVFVYGKLSDDSEPSDYKNVDADLGVLKLLEGFNDAITKFYL